MSVTKVYNICTAAKNAGEGELGLSLPAFFFCWPREGGASVNRKRQVAISVSAALLSGLLVYAVYQLQLRQLRMEETVEVVVPRQFVPKERFWSEAIAHLRSRDCSIN